MISLYYRTENPYSLYGIRHFIRRYGIPVSLNTSSQSGIVIAYGTEATGNFIIGMKENEIQDHLCGKCCTSSGSIPLCEEPVDTGPAETVIAHFENSTVRYPCVSRSEQGITIGIDIFKETGYLLSGHLDSLESSLSQDSRQDLASQPVVDFLEQVLFDAILTACSARRIPLVQKSLWPDGKNFAVCLTHDIDEIKKTYQWISRPLRYLMKRDFGGFKGQVHSLLEKIRGFEPYYTYDDIITIEQGLGVKSTYYILKESGKATLFSRKTWYLYGRNRSLQSPEMLALIKRLSFNGDEVAIHGSYFSYILPDLLEKETRELEGILGEKVVGTRQHNLNLDIPGTWELQIRAGLKYDTSLGFKDTIGFRWGTSYPFFPGINGVPIPILEIPLIIMDICLESRSDKISDCLRIADQIKHYQGVLTLLWHPPIFNRQEYPEAQDIYIAINQYCQKQGAWITRARDIYAWSVLRDEFGFSCTCNESTCTVIPSTTDSDLYFTLYLPPDKECTIHSGNADIIGREEDRIHIKTHDLKKNIEIVLGIA